MRRPWWALGFVAAACVKRESGGTSGPTESAPPSESESETGPETESESETETEPEPIDRLLDGDHQLVVPHTGGLSLYDHEGVLQTSWSWASIVGCATCFVGGASADGDGLLVSFAVGGGSAPPKAAPSPGGGLDGGVVRIDAGGLDWALETGLSFPHDAVRDPSDNTVIVPEAFGNRLVWIAGDGSSSDAVHSLEVEQAAPNGMELVSFEGARLALFSNRGRGLSEPGGQISLWDVTDSDAPVMQWIFPEDGPLDTPHGPILRELGGTWYLLYAHSYGAEGGGSIGVATTPDPRTPPTYVADLVPPEGFPFVRGVDLTDDGLIIATDSGPEGDPGANGSVRVGALPELTATGATGVAEVDQVFVEWDAPTLIDDLTNPFEGWLWVPTF